MLKRITDFHVGIVPLVFLSAMTGGVYLILWIRENSFTPKSKIWALVIAGVQGLQYLCHILALDLIQNATVDAAFSCITVASLLGLLQFINILTWSVKNAPGEKIWKPIIFNYGFIAWKRYGWL